MAMRRCPVLASVLVLVHSLMSMTSATLILSGENVTMTFGDVEASFASPVKLSKHGVLYAAVPPDACSNLATVSRSASNNSVSFVLIARGGCTFEEKVRAAQNVGYDAAIIYDDRDEEMIAMAGNSIGIHIAAVFITKNSGEILKRYAGSSNYGVWIVPNYENSAWSIMAISLISLLAMSSVLATCLFVRRQRVRRIRPVVSRSQEFRRMSSGSVTALPSLIFTIVQEDNCTSMTCAICLEDYTKGEKLRILPCRHKFHALCIDCWLTSWRTFCPVCKRDAKSCAPEPPASESTPLLASTPPSLQSSASHIPQIPSPFSSSSSLRTLSIPQIPSPLSSSSSLRALSIPQIPSPFSSSSSFRALSIPRVPHLHQSPFFHSSANMSSQRTHNSYFLSSPSIGCLSLSPLNSALPAASPSLVSSSGFHPRLLLRDASSATLNSYASAHSISEC